MAEFVRVFNSRPEPLKVDVDGIKYQIPPGYTDYPKPLADKFLNSSFAYRLKFLTDAEREAQVKEKAAKDAETQIMAEKAKKAWEDRERQNAENAKRLEIEADINNKKALISKNTAEIEMLKAEIAFKSSEIERLSGLNEEIEAELKAKTTAKVVEPEVEQDKPTQETPVATTKKAGKTRKG